jgi:hypothetical protein
VRAVVLIALAGCGRIAFDPARDGPAADDGARSDQRVDAVVDPDLLFHLSFENGFFDVARGHTTVCYGPCPTLAPGRIGVGAASFNGTGCFSVVDATDLHPTTYTFAVWAAIDVPAQNVDLIARPLNGATTSIDTFEMWAQPDSGIVTLANGVQTLVTGLDITQWHHYVGVYDGSALISYRDGSLSGADSGATTTMYGPDSYFVGCDRDNGVDVARLSGRIDDVRFYGRALTAQEVGVLAAGN